MSERNFTIKALRDLGEGTVVGADACRLEAIGIDVSKPNEEYLAAPGERLVTIDQFGCPQYQDICEQCPFQVLTLLKNYELSMDNFAPNADTTAKIATTRDAIRAEFNILDTTVKIATPRDAPRPKFNFPDPS